MEELLDSVLNATWKAPHAKGYYGEIAVDNVVLYDLMAISANEHATEQVRAIASLKLHDLKNWLNSPAAGTQIISDQAHIFFAAKQIEQFEKDPKLINVPPPAEPPDGPPIGADDDGDFWD
jgi:hypothetical protein